MDFAPQKGHDYPFKVNLLVSRVMVATRNSQMKMNDIFVTFPRHLKNTLAPAAMRAAGSAMSECVEKVATIYGVLCFGRRGSIAISYDGMCKTRGHSFHIGVGTVIELFSGYVLDYMVLSSFCLGCEVGPKPL